MKPMSLRIQECANGYVIYDDAAPPGFVADRYVARTIAELKTLVGALAIQAQMPEPPTGAREAK